MNEWFWEIKPCKYLCGTFYIIVTSNKNFQKFIGEQLQVTNNIKNAKLYYTYTDAEIDLEKIYER